MLKAGGGRLYIGAKLYAPQGGGSIFWRSAFLKAPQSRGEGVQPSQQLEASQKLGVPHAGILGVEYTQLLSGGPTPPLGVAGCG